MVIRPPLWIKDMPSGKRIKLLFILLVAFFVVTCSTYWWIALKYRDDVDSAYLARLGSANALAEAGSALWELRYDFPQFMIGDADSRQNILEQQSTIYAYIENRLTAYSRIVSDEEELNAATSLRSAYLRYKQVIPKFFALWQAGKTDDAIAWKTLTADPFGAAAVQAFSKQILMQRTVSDRMQIESARNVERALGLVSIITIALIILLIAAFNQTIKYHKLNELRATEAAERAREGERVARQQAVELEQIYMNVPIGIALIGRNFALIRANKMISEIMGFLHNPLDAENVSNGPVALQIESLCRNIFENGLPVINYEAVIDEGSSSLGERHILITCLPVTSETGEISSVLAVILEVTERKKIELDLRIAAAAFQAQEGMMITDANRVILRVNQAFTRDTGYSPDEVIGKTPRILQSGRHNTEFYRDMWLKIAETDGWQGEVWEKRKDGTIYPKWLAISAVRHPNGSVTHYIGTHYDITAQKQAEERIRQLAFFDQLTGLPNRTLLQDRLSQAMVTGARTGHYGALLIIDLDNFKTLNDTHGHDKGDLLLIQAAQRLSETVRDDDTVARLGGDEFVVILIGLSTTLATAVGQAERTAEKILLKIGTPYSLNGVVHSCSASIGITMFCRQPVTAEQLMKQADLSLYRKKFEGRNGLRFFDPEMETTMRRRASLEADLRMAINDDDFVLHYQPFVTNEGRIIGCEALVRWQHSERGLISPAEFIPLAEETGLILRLGDWVLESACTQLAHWATHPDLAHLIVSVNVSAQQFREPGFVDTVFTVLKKTGACPTNLKLELTESLQVDHIDNVIEKMHALKKAGIGFSLDDFGTGYSSLAYLKKLPLDHLKIDKSFVTDILSDTNDAAIARTVVTLAESLGIGVIAEGVETEAQRDYLCSIGCHIYQGYYFSRPLSADAFAKSFARN